jgi:hypothetical protein
MQLYQDRALPNLSDNLKCGNSLIGSDYFAGRLDIDPEELKRVNPFDWNQAFPEVMKVGGFDCVIGNPPYVRQELLGSQKEYFQKHYRVYSGIADLYTYFIEKGVSLLKPGGLFSYIVANKWMRANYGQPLRVWLKAQELEEITDFGDLPVFKGATTYPCILRIRKSEATKAGALPSTKVTLVRSLDFQDLGEYVRTNSFSVKKASLDEKGWSLADNLSRKLLEKIGSAGIPLDSYINGKLYYGIKTGLNEAFVINLETRNRLIRKDRKSGEIIKPFLAGRDIKRYMPPQSEKFLILIPRGWTNKNRKTKDPWEYLQETFPATADYLELFKIKAQKRYDKGEYWWELRACDYYEEFKKSKIAFPDISEKGNFCIDINLGFYTGNTTYFFPSIDLYLLGILNSQLMTYYYKNNYAVFRGGYLRFFEQYLKELPIHPINLSDPVDKARHDRMVKLVDSMLALHKQLSEAKSAAQKEIIQRQIDATDKEIDRLVYELYGLTDDEIKIVEEGTK